MRGASTFTEYSRVHRHSLTGELPPLLLRQAERRPAGTLVDLGCGDGTIISGLLRRDLLPERVYAVDLSPERVERASSLSDRVVGITADATAVTDLDDGCADAVVSSQVIEHVPDQRAFVAEVARLLRPGGWWYVGSVLRGRGGWWFYRRDGRWWLDPTHVREYARPADFADALTADGLVLERMRTQPMTYPLSDLTVRAAVAAGAVSPDAAPGLFASDEWWARRLRRIAVRVPGYRLIEACGHRR